MMGVMVMGRVQRYMTQRSKHHESGRLYDMV